MEVAFLYTPERKAFGHQCNFDDNIPRVMEAIPSTSVYEEEYVKRNPSILEVDTTPSYSINTCNTQRFVQKSKGCSVGDLANALQKIFNKSYIKNIFYFFCKF